MPTTRAHSTDPATRARLDRIEVVTHQLQLLQQRQTALLAELRTLTDLRSQPPEIDNPAPPQGIEWIQPDDPRYGIPPEDWSDL